MSGTSNRARNANSLAWQALPGAVARREPADQYARLLRAHLRKRSEESLQRSYELGRRLLVGGTGVMGMASIHHQAVQRALRDAGASERVLETLATAHGLFIESLSPYEMTQRTFHGANLAWRKLNEKLEAEAKRIAHALHDEAGQLLATAHIALADLASKLPPRSRRRLQETQRILDQIEEQFRRISHELRPTILDDLGLVPAVEYLAEGVSRRGGFRVAVECRIEERLAPTLETALYRIIQEALTNVSRHAQAKHAGIRLWHAEHEVRCIVADDGVGFDAEGVLRPGGHSGLGLMGMRERLAAVGGALTISTAPGRGTELVVTIPRENIDVIANPYR